MSSAKCEPFYLDLNLLIINVSIRAFCTVMFTAKYAKYSYIYQDNSIHIYYSVVQLKTTNVCFWMEFDIRNNRQAIAHLNY